MKISSIGNLKQSEGEIVVTLDAIGRVEHGILPGVIDLAEYGDVLQLHEMGALDQEGNRVPVTVLALDVQRVTAETLKWLMEDDVSGPFHAAWTANDHELEFIIASSVIDGMKALREIHRAALTGRAFAESDMEHFSGGLTIVAKNNMEVVPRRDLHL